MSSSLNTNSDRLAECAMESAQLAVTAPLTSEPKSAERMPGDCAWIHFTNARDFWAMFCGTL